MFFLLHLSSILKSDNLKSKYNILSENNLPESRILIDRKKNKIENKGKEKIYLPAYTIAKASKIEDKIIIILINFEIFFADVLANQLRTT